MDEETYADAKRDAERLAIRDLADATQRQNELLDEQNGLVRAVIFILLVTAVTGITIAVDVFVRLDDMNAATRLITGGAG